MTSFSNTTDLSTRAHEEILTPEALEFLEALHGEFAAQRENILSARRDRAEDLRRGASLGFLPETREIREDNWVVVSPATDYLDRRVEITGPTDRKMVINALNSGARGFMADFEDANSPAWHKQVEGQLNLRDAVDGTIDYQSSDGREYMLGDSPAILLMRPRGWHLPEWHLRFDGTPASGSLVDFGLYAFHSAERLLANGGRPHLYLPKLEHHLEARLWNDVFAWTQEALGMPSGTFRATVLIETLPAVFQMHEILFELREHSDGLNAGRWDYIFSLIKTVGDRPEFILPDRGDVRMTVPFMAAYSDLLVKTCHERGAFAMGGMAALVPNRQDPAATERAIAAVQEDKRREATAGFDGTWVAHPDVVPIATGEFDVVLGSKSNQIDRRRDDVNVDAAELLDVASTPGQITLAGLRGNVSVTFQYISFWLGGRGAAAIDNLMEDAATAEIARAQIWQWIRHGVQLDDGRTITRELVSEVLGSEMARIRSEVGETLWVRGRPNETRAIFKDVALADELPDFLTLIAYPYIASDAADSSGAA
ncbi:MAG: malate synthase A [Solirubrobacteraceae bacterium]